MICVSVCVSVCTYLSVHSVFIAFYNCHTCPIVYVPICIITVCACACKGEVYFIILSQESISKILFPHLPLIFVPHLLSCLPEWCYIIFILESVNLPSIC